MWKRKQSSCQYSRVQSVSSPVNSPTNSCCILSRETMLCVEVTCCPPGKLLSCWVFYCFDFRSRNIVFTPLSSEFDGFLPSFFPQTDWIRHLDSGWDFFFLLPVISDHTHLDAHTRAHTSSFFVVVFSSLLLSPPSNFRSSSCAQQHHKYQFTRSCSLISRRNARPTDHFLLWFISKINQD